MMRTIIIISVFVFYIISCRNNTKQYSNNSIKHDDVFSYYDTLKLKNNALPVNLDSLYFIARQVLTLANTFPNNDTIVLSEIYTDCALMLRLHCDCEGSQPLRCCNDTTLIIDSYKKAIRIHYLNNDTFSNNFTNVLFQLADVYEQLDQPVLSLPVRQKILAIQKTKERLEEKYRVQR